MHRPLCMKFTIFLIACFTACLPLQAAHRARVTPQTILKIFQSRLGARLSSIHFESLFTRSLAALDLAAGLASASVTSLPTTAGGIGRARPWSPFGATGHCRAKWDGVHRRAARRLGVFGGVRDMSRIDFFGIGPRTLFDDRSAFRLRESTLGLRGSHRVVPAVKLGGMVAAYMPDLGRGANRSVPSIEQLFSESSVPGGLSAEPVFGRYRGYVEFMHPALADPASGGNGQLWRDVSSRR